MQPVAPTCAKKVSKQVMSGGVLKTVMVDNGKCLKAWEAWDAYLAAVEVEAQRVAAEAQRVAAEAQRVAAKARATAFRELAPGLSGDSAFGTMKWIPAGTFLMGSPSSEPDRGDHETQHSVTLTKGYWMMEHEVTQGEWQSVMGSNPSEFTACGPTCPVEQVSWDDAVAFAKKASARDGVTYTLPTEAQWEYAARGGQQTLYAGSNEATSVGWISDNSGGTTHAVCGKARNEYGLCDMTGNVFEWTSDWYGAYAGSATDPRGAVSGPRRVFRGGSWVDTAVFARAAYRYSGSPGYRNSDLGLRLSRTIP